MNFRILFYLFLLCLSIVCCKSEQSRNIDSSLNVRNKILKEVTKFVKTATPYQLQVTHESQKIHIYFERLNANLYKCFISINSLEIKKTDFKVEKQIIDGIQMSIYSPLDMTYSGLPDVFFVPDSYGLTLLCEYSKGFVELNKLETVIVQEKNDKFINLDSLEL